MILNRAGVGTLARMVVNDGMTIVGLFSDQVEIHCEAWASSKKNFSTNGSTIVLEVNMSLHP